MDVLARYIEGSLTPVEVEEVESFVEEFPLYADALEGLREVNNPRTAALASMELQHRTKQMLRKHRPLITEFKWNQQMTAAVAVLVVLFAAATVVFVQMRAGSALPNTDATIAQNTEETAPESEENLFAEAEVKEANKSELIEKEASPKQVAPAPTAKKKPKKVTRTRAREKKSPARKQSSRDLKSAQATKAEEDREYAEAEKRKQALPNETAVSNADNPSQARDDFADESAGSKEATSLNEVSVVEASRDKTSLTPAQKATLASQNLKQGAAFYAQKKYVKAIPILQQVLKGGTKSEIFEAEWMLGQAWLRIGKKKKARHILEKIANHHGPHAMEAILLLEDF